MITLISPAKRLREDATTEHPVTEPQFASQTAALVQEAKKLSAGKLAKLMHLSDALATLNYDRFQAHGEMPKAPAALMFDGDTYAGLEAQSLDADELAFANDRLRILSGLYGLLRPLDMIEPYRLEMGTRFKTPKGKNLYEFWGDQISEALNTQAKAAGATAIVNCASQEYFGAVNTKALDVPVITPVFYEARENGPKIISFFAKKARGAMARYIIQRRLTDTAALTEFDSGGYVYSPKLSSENGPAFLREA
ncbi:peroxide stress protein YaaA [Lentibacter algarum]|uniref:peroxide stress protein YaaA n=1 Tax=Lentibacter algarum TaxID=576131 RepID=UPI001C074458|nr:peroxide stress protein YaaA [Lentibacter algarum]MBU2981351.1 peroxide stress protein YaaA [Lentibacter algarum]